MSGRERRPDVIVPGDAHHQVTAFLQGLADGVVGTDANLRLVQQKAAWLLEQLPPEHTHRYVPFMSHIGGTYRWEYRALAEPRYPVICDPCQDVQWMTTAELVNCGLICNSSAEEWGPEHRARWEAQLGEAVVQHLIGEETRG